MSTAAQSLERLVRLLIWIGSVVATGASLQTKPATNVAAGVSWLHPSDAEYQAAMISAVPHKMSKEEKRHSVKILYFDTRL